MNRYILYIVLLAPMVMAEDAYTELHEIGSMRDLKDNETHHQPQDWQSLPEGELGESIKRGYSLFMNTQQLHKSGKVNNGMNCTNCHIGGGQVADAAPMWAAYVSYPAYRGKNKRVNTFGDRLQGCFLYSMNAKDGKPPEVLSQEIKDLNAYSYWVSFGGVVDNNLPGRGFANIDKPKQEPDFARGEEVYQKQCAVCHAENGQGRQVAERYVFPPLWGKDSYNWGAGMHRINTAAAFIKANMPLGQGYSLSDQDAWDVALYINSHERPQEPRFKGNVEQTKEAFHQHNGTYGLPSPLDKHILGSQAY
ncbi:c-type cytochrome [Vibrio hyugaensis]|nr:c-type cytochrome [Vibrio hyugaensis]